jgi:putative ABC transport system substrate-binding protein
VKRRDFLTLLGAAAASPLLRPLAARAQPTGMPVIGYLHPGSPALEVARLRAFLQGLNDTGYVEGRDVAIEYRWAEDHYDRLPALAADLVQRQVAVIVAGGGPPALAAKVATKTIPVVFYHGGDPVELGLVASLSRPGGNLTGVTALTVELTSKRLEVMRELVPSATEIALLVNPANSNADALSRDVQAAGRTLGLQSMSCARARNATSRRFLQPWANCAPAGS